MLFVEDVEGVACTVDDMEARGRSGSLVQRGWSEEGGKINDEWLSSVGADGARLCPRGDSVSHYGIFLVEAVLVRKVLKETLYLYSTGTGSQYWWSTFKFSSHQACVNCDFTLTSRLLVSGTS